MGHGASQEARMVMDLATRGHGICTFSEKAPFCDALGMAGNALQASSDIGGVSLTRSESFAFGPNKRTC